MVVTVIVLLVNALALQAGHSFELRPATSIETGDPARGREVFHGKGICFFCHGQDGRLDRRPPLHPETEEIIKNFDPPPADLRDSASLRLKTEDERFRIIRHGHLGTGMLPDTTLTDAEIRDLLAYLATLRERGPGTLSTDDLQISGDHGFIRAAHHNGAGSTGDGSARRHETRKKGLCRLFGPLEPGALAIEFLVKAGARVVGENKHRWCSSRSREGS